MLRDLIVSKVRIKLLQTFLGNPKEIFYVRQLVRAVGEEINAVRRELARMENPETTKHARSVTGSGSTIWEATPVGEVFSPSRCMTRCSSSLGLSGWMREKEL